MIWIAPLTTLQKAGIVVHGLVAALCTAIGTSAALGLIGFMASELDAQTGLLHLGENRPWLPLIALQQGFLLGLVLGGFVCRKVWRDGFGRLTQT